MRNSTMVITALFLVVVVCAMAQLKTELTEFESNVHKVEKSLKH